MAGLLEKQLGTVDFPDFQIFLLNSKTAMGGLIDALNGPHSNGTQGSEVRLRIHFSFHFHFALISKLT